LFDWRYELLFLKKGLEDGLIGGLEADKKEILSRAEPDPHREKTMMQMLLLYDKCFCLETRTNEGLNLNRLIDEDLISYIPKRLPRSRTFSTADALALKDILLPQVDLYGHSLNQKDFNIAIEFNLFLEEADRKGIDYDKAFELLKEVAPDSFVPYGMGARHMLLLVSYRLLKEQLEWSDKLQVPVLKAFRSDNLGKRIDSLDRRAYQRIEDAERSRLVLGIFFGSKARLVLPVVNSLQEVIRLRKKKEIVDFREKIFSWMHDLQDGRINFREIDQEMTDARNSIRAIGRCSRIGTWLTFLSIPFTIASTITHLPLGVPFSVASIGLVTTSQLLRKRYGWYLFGIE
jgi:hypothetical protein